MNKKLAKKNIRIVAALLLVVTLLSSIVLAAPVTAQAPEKAKNVIIMIGDGMGYNNVIATDFYQYGESGRQVFESFPVTVGMSTYEYESVLNAYPYPILAPIESENPDFAVYGYDSALAWSDFGYVKWTDGTNMAAYNNNSTDSSSAATAMSTGKKTKDGYVGVDINKIPQPNIAEFAESIGKATGVVTTVPLSHATPAGFSSIHTDNRNDYAGIARQMLYSSSLDVIMGCGAADFNNDGVAIEVTAKTAKYIGAETWADIADGTVRGSDADGDGVADDWTVIRTKQAFTDMAYGPVPDRVLGIPEVYESLQYYRAPAYSQAAANTEAFTPNLPTLSDMSKAALNVLNNDPDGFFLMIEGGAIDWANHFNQFGRMIEETIDFNKAVNDVINWIEMNGGWDENLLIVTADHETGYIWGPGSGVDANDLFKPVVNNGVGKMPGMAYYGDIGGFNWHTNSLVPMFAKGVGASILDNLADETDPVRGAYIDNTEIINAVVGAFAPAEFSLDSLAVGEAAGGKVPVSVTVSNTGYVDGSYTVTLNLNGAKAMEQAVTVAGLENEVVNFEVAVPAAAGTYTVTVAGLTGASGSFAVAAAPVTSTATVTATATTTLPAVEIEKTNSTMAMVIGIVGAVIIIVLVVLLVRKKK